MFSMYIFLNLFGIISNIKYQISQIYKMQATTSAKLDLTKQHLQILEYTDSLFTRWSLRRNTYLFKHLKPTLQIPLFILAQQRRISQITQSQSTLIEALKLSQFVQISQDNRTIKLLQLPTIRTIDQSTLLKIQKLVKQYIKNKTNQDKINIIKPLEYIISNKTDDGYYYLTIKQKKKDNKDILKQLIEHYIKQNKQKLVYSCQPLYDDIKQCIAKLRKNKREGNNNSNSQYHHGYDNYNNTSKYNSKNSNSNESQINNPVYTRQNMMMMYPGMYYPVYNNMTGMMSEQVYGQPGSGKSYGVFIRKAVDSDQQQQPQSKIQDYASTNQQKQQQQLTSINQPARQQKPNNKQQLPSNTTNNNNSNKTNNRKYEYKNTPNSDNNKQQNNAKSKKQKYNNSNSNSNSNGNGNRNKVVLDDNDFPSIG